ncbi:ribose-5-phosphate isomerase A, partial [Treponema endosymbiont of Eucomonympha sp.]
MILDCRWQCPVDPAEYEALINAIAGVVENGFFTRR